MNIELNERKLANIPLAKKKALYKSAKREVRLKEKYGKQIVACEPLPSGRLTAWFKCADHGKFKAQVGVMLAGCVTYGCPNCRQEGNRNRLSNTAYTEKLAAVHKHIVLVGPYTSMSAKTDHKCTKCTTVWSVKPGNLIHCGSGCPSCAYSRKKVTLAGRRLSLRGYEPLGIRWLLRQGVSAKDIVTDNDETIPKVAYRFDGKDRRYTPDLYLPKYNVVVEIKSLSTLGLISSGYYDPQALFDKTVAKTKECLRLGYKFLLMVMSPTGRRIYLPHNWYRFSRSQVATWAKKMGLYWEYEHLENEDFLTNLAGPQTAL